MTILSFSKRFWNRFYVLVKFGQKQRKLSFLRFLVKIDPTTWKHKFRTKHRKNIPRPWFESLGSILSIFNIFIIFSCLFVTKTVFQPLYAYFAYGKVIYRFGYKKASKKLNFVDAIVMRWKFASRAFKIWFYNDVK